MFLKKDNSILPRFQPAKSVDIGKQARMRKNYKRNFEIAMIMSLLIAIFLTRWMPVTKNHKKKIEFFINPFQVVEMPFIEEEPPPPIEKPQLLEQIEVSDIEIIEEKEEEEPAPQIDFELEIEDDRLLDSQLKQDFKTKINNYRQWKLNSDKLALSTNYRSHSTESSGLKLNTKLNDATIIERGSTEKLDISLEKPEIKSPKKAPEADKRITSIFEPTDQVDVVILKPPKSSLVLTEYRMWSKLSGELDRIDKRHFDNNLPNLIKNKDGIFVSFLYRDGIQHEIVWRKGGKTSIKVIGKNRKSALEELQRALSALLQLTINYK